MQGEEEEEWMRVEQQISKAREGNLELEGFGVSKSPTRQGKTLFHSQFPIKF